MLSYLGNTRAPRVRERAEGARTLQGLGPTLVAGWVCLCAVLLVGRTCHGAVLFSLAVMCFTSTMFPLAATPIPAVRRFRARSGDRSRL